MPFVFAVFLAIHGLIHLLGFVKAFRLAELPHLHDSVFPLFGLLWLTAALLFVAAAICLFAWPRGWWAIGGLAIVVSTVAIIPSWSDAKLGAIANGIALIGVVFGFLAQGPLSLRAMYDHDVDAMLPARSDAAPIVDRDLDRLPAPVQRYLRVSGVVGQPHVQNFHARMHGRFRNGPEAAWMPFTAEQYNFADLRARLFYMTASRFSIPFQGYHRYVSASAAMRVKLAAVLPVLDVSGDTMTQGETVTLFNDMCILAPQTLIDPTIVWRLVDARTADATFTNAGHTIQARLEFSEAGDLVNFRSDDRYQTSPDGKGATRLPWSTPMRGTRSFGAIRLGAGGEARWHEPGREYAYIQLDLDAVEYNVASR